MYVRIVLDVCVKRLEKEQKSGEFLLQVWRTLFHCCRDSETIEHSLVGSECFYGPLTFFISGNKLEVWFHVRGGNNQLKHSLARII